MSTLDQAFIRAYTKDADYRGTAEPEWYRADPAGGVAVAPPQAEPAAQSPSRSSLDCLYAEGMWYRIEPREPAPRMPHATAAVVAQPLNPRVRQPAPVSPSHSFADPPSPRPLPPPLPKRPRSPRQEASSTFASSSPSIPEVVAEVEGRKPAIFDDFTSQFVISAAVGFVSSADVSASETAPTQPARTGAAPLNAATSGAADLHTGAPKKPPLNAVQPDTIAERKTTERELSDVPPQRVESVVEGVAQREVVQPHVVARDDVQREAAQADAVKQTAAQENVAQQDVAQAAGAQREVARPDVNASRQGSGETETPEASAAASAVEPAANESARLDSGTALNVPAPHFAISGDAKPAEREGGRSAPASGIATSVPASPSSASASAASTSNAATPGDSAITDRTSTGSPTSGSRAGQSKIAESAAAVAAVNVSTQQADAELERQRAKRDFHAAWEVDALAWPELVERLLRRETRRFTLLSERLAEIARAGRNVIAVTSPGRGLGRTTLSLCLARRAAAMGLKVALVDADFENPQLASQLRINPTCGWQDTIAANLPMTEAAVASMRDGVTLLPLRVASVGQAEDEASLDPSAVADLIDLLSKCFDLVIFDMEPVEIDDEPPAESTGLHEAVAGLVVYDTTAGAEQLAAAVAQLRAAGIETIGAVENFFKPEAAA